MRGLPSCSCVCVCVDDEYFMNLDIDCRLKVPRSRWLHSHVFEPLRSARWGGEGEVLDKFKCACLWSWSLWCDVEMCYWRRKTLLKMWYSCVIFRRLSNDECSHHHHRHWWRTWAYGSDPKVDSNLIIKQSLNECSRALIFFSSAILKIERMYTVVYFFITAIYWRHCCGDIHIMK